MTEADPGSRTRSLDADRRAALLALLRDRDRDAGRPDRAGDGIPALPRDGRAHPVSFAQARVLFLEEFDPGTAQHNMPHAFTLDGPLDEAALQRALDALTVRHEALRTTFLREDGQDLQLVTHPAPVPLARVDLTGQPQEEREAMARAVLAEDAQRPFDLERGPLFRAKLVLLAPERALLFLDFHHAICDGWSVGLVMADLAAGYRAFTSDAAQDGAAAGGTTQDDAAAGGADPLPVQYCDFAGWQRERLAGPELRRGLDFWKEQLAGTPGLELPTDRPRPAVRGHRGALLTVSWPRALLTDLTALARACEATLFSVLLAGFECLLARHGGRSDFAVGTMVAGRELPELEPVVGLFANTVVLRADLAGRPSFAELVRRVRDRTLAAWDHQDVPFERVVNALDLPRDLSRTALFQAMLVLQNTPPAPFSLPGLTVGAVEPDSRTAKTDLTLYVTESAPSGDEGLTVSAEYSTELYDAATARDLLGQLRTLLTAAVADPQAEVDRLPLLGARRLAELTVRHESSAIPDTTVERLVRERAAERPDAPAVSAAGGCPGPSGPLDYAGLDRAADRLARHLAARGARPGRLVGVALERGTDLPVALLAVARTGAAYVPLDPDYPAARLAVMTEDAGLALTVTTRALAGRIPVPAADLVLLDEEAPAIAARPTGPLPVVVGPEHTAYVIFTSGSTGRPKGVRVSHRALVNLLGSVGERCAIGAADTLLAVTSLSFDIAGLELWAPLVTGGHLVVCGRPAAAAADQLTAVLADHAPTLMQATPATWRLLTDSGWKGDPSLTVLCGGERLPEELAEALRPRVKALWNMYGPTETTIWSAAGQVEVGPERTRVPIGPALANTDLHVLDPHLVPQPDGVPGEVWIGGAGLAEGYHGRAALTADRFRPHPAGPPGARIYRTGDLARRRPDGRLDFLGRLDDQVKVRGYRIELGDVEAALARHPAVAQAVAAVRSTAAGERLVGYVLPAPGAEPTVAELRAHLAQAVPDYMVPALFATLSAFPLTPNGKIDRRALPAPEQAATASGTVHEEPDGPVERTLAEIWVQLLGAPKVGRRDDFFALGGDSLLVVRMVGAAAQAEIRLTAKQVFQHRTLAQLAAAAGTVRLLAVQGEISGPSPLPIATRQFFESETPRPDYHSLSFLLRARERLDAGLLDQVLDQLVGHHDTLRLRLVDRDGVRGLHHDPHRRRPLVESVDLAELDDDAAREEIQRHTDRMQTRFTMAEGELFGAVLFDLGPQREQQLLLAGHYLIADVIGWQILVGDLDVLYRRRAHAEPYRLPAKTTSQHEWLGRLAEFAQGPEAAAERGYWLDPARSHAAALPQDRPEGDNRVAANRALFLTLTTDRTEALLRRANKGAKLPLDAILLWAIVRALGDWAGTETLPVDLYVPGRESPWEDVDLSRTVGWLTYRYPVWLTGDRALPPADAVREVSRQLKEVPRGGLGHGALRYFGSDPAAAAALAAQPVPEVMFNFFGTPAGGFQLLQPLAGDSGHYHDTESRRMRLLMINGAVAHGRLRLEWEYSAGRHDEPTIQHLIDRCTTHLVELTESCPESDRD